VFISLSLANEAAGGYTTDCIGEWLVSAVMSMYTGAKTVVRTLYGNSNGFEVKVGMHQGPLLFVIVMKALSREFRVAYHEDDQGLMSGRIIWRIET